MNRRELVHCIGLSAASAFVCATAGSSPALAALQCNDNLPTPIAPLGSRTCSSGIQSKMIEVAALKRQLQSNWCWAACISMIFGYYGHPLSQKRIVTEAYGHPENMPANPSTILGMLNRDWTDDNGESFMSVASAGSTAPPLAAQDLANDMPLIIGSQGHAMVLTALTYSAFYVSTPYGPQLGMVNVDSATVRDPWPGRGRRDLAAQEWYSITFATQIRIL